MSSDSFWESLLENSSTQLLTASIDTYLSGKAIGEAFDGVRGLTDSARAKNALKLPVPAGERVAFVGNTGSYLSYASPPEDGLTGTVVNVKSANGDITSHEGKVFVTFDDGVLRTIHAEHLRPAPRRVASLGDLTAFLKNADGTLIHKSTRDLWTMKRDANGYLIERLFDDSGEPLKA
jgi:hypothetical protein